MADLLRYAFGDLLILRRCAWGVTENRNPTPFKGPAVIGITRIHYEVVSTLGEGGVGAVYLAMELAEGEDPSAIIARGPVLVDEYSTRRRSPRI